MKEMKKKHGDEGFTLVETMIASMVLAIGLLALLQLITISVYGSRAGKDMTVANSLAKQLLEDMKNQGYTKAMNGMGPHTISDGTDNVYTFGTAVRGTAIVTQPVTVGTKTYTMVAQYQDNTPSTGLSKVTVTVSWTTKGNPHSVSFVTYFNMS